MAATTLVHNMRPLFALAHTSLTLSRVSRQPLGVPAVGLQFRARSQAAIEAAKPPPPAPEPTEDQLSADFFDEAEVGTEEAAEWEGEEIQDGVFVSLVGVPDIYVWPGHASTHVLTSSSAAHSSQPYRGFEQERQQWTSAQDTLYQAPQPPVEPPSIARHPRNGARGEVCAR